jgi:hypothetical protein
MARLFAPVELTPQSSQAICSIRIPLYGMCASLGVEQLARSQLLASGIEARVWLLLSRKIDLEATR